MRHLSIVLATLLIAGSIYPTPATAGTPNATALVNLSDKCAWVTLYEATAVTPWHIATGHNSPGFLKPGQRWTYGQTGGGSGEMKIRAEVKQHADCTGPTIADTYDVLKSINCGIHCQAQLVGPVKGAYKLWYIH